MSSALRVIKSISDEENICRIEVLSFSFDTGTSTGGAVTIGDIFSQNISGDGGTAVGKDGVRKAGFDDEDVEKEG